MGSGMEPDGSGWPSVGLRLFERDRRSWPVHGVGPGGQAQMREDCDNHRGIFDGGDECDRAPQEEQVVMSIWNTRLSNCAQLRGRRQLVGYAGDI